MTGSRDTLAEAVGLVAAFERSDWLDLDLRCGTLCVRLSRRAGGSPSDVQADDLKLTTVRAPHLGTVRSVAPLGQDLALGDVCVVLDLLGEAVEVCVPAAGHVAQVQVNAGDLVDYDQPLLTLADGIRIVAAAAALR